MASMSPKATRALIEGLKAIAEMVTVGPCKECMCSVCQGFREGLAMATTIPDLVRGLNEGNESGRPMASGERSE